MQTFLPYSDFIKSAKCLDYRRLGKQRVEAWQIYLALTEPNYGWKHHPIVKMWKGYEIALLYYGCCICQEWIKRGYKDNMLKKFLKKLPSKCLLFYPSWLKDTQFIRGMRSNLLRKDKEYYSQFNWNVPDNLPYKWVI